MALVVDLILIAILALCVFLGWKKGFIKALGGFVSYILAFAIANICWKFIAVYVRKLPFLQNMITEGVEAPEFAADATFFDKLQTLFSFFTGDVVQNGNAEATKAVLMNYLAEALTMIISFAVIFIVAMIVVKLLFRLLNAIVNKIPGLKQINGILGSLIGLLNGCFWTWAFCNVFVKALLPALNHFKPDIFPMEMAESFIVTLCTKINPITYIIQFINLIS